MKIYLFPLNFLKKLRYTLAPNKLTSGEVKVAV